jgi:hypothetical protein
MEFSEDYPHKPPKCKFPQGSTHTHTHTHTYTHTLFAIQHLHSRTHAHTSEVLTLRLWNMVRHKSDAPYISVSPSNNNRIFPPKHLPIGNSVPEYPQRGGGMEARLARKKSQILTQLLDQIINTDAKTPARHFNQADLVWRARLAGLAQPTQSCPGGRLPYFYAGYLQLIYQSKKC